MPVRPLSGRPPRRSSSCRPAHAPQCRDRSGFTIWEDGAGAEPNHQANHHDYCRFLVQKSRDTNRNTNIYQDHVLSRMSKLVGTRARTGDPLILCPPHLIFVEPRSENSLKYSSSVIPPSAHFRAIAGADRSKLHLKMSKSSTWLDEFCDQREVSASTPRPILTRRA